MNTSGVVGAFELPGGVAEDAWELAVDEIEFGWSEGSLRWDLE